MSQRTLDRPGDGDVDESAVSAGLNLVSVLIVLLVLVAVVAALFWVVPGWLGNSTINVNVR
jgi:hypothetical protein